MLKALDVETVRTALAEGAATPLGREAAGAVVPTRDVERVRRWHDEVQELLRLQSDGARLPVAGVEDERVPVARAAKGSILDVGEIRRLGVTLDQVLRLDRWLADVDAPVLSQERDALAVDADVAQRLVDAIDDQGRLSARAYPTLGGLRERVASLHASIRRTLEELVRGDALADVLQDRFVTQRGDRYVLPVKANTDRRSVGIVHGMSGSGQTAFVEPHEVVALNNDLRLAEGALEAEERRILTSLSSMVGRAAPAIQTALQAVTRLDMVGARAHLAERMDALRPVVGTEGRVRLVAARHPVLVLRGLDVVANDLSLGPDVPALVISGPNTGGKTVALKTLGLAAWLVRVGCFVPADEGSRVDLFGDVMALVGDHQDVLGDHSSFSGHLVGLSAMLDRAGPGALLLVDEIASGTDPQQGAALAHAFVEAVIDRGARIVLTTHFHRLKLLGQVDDRVAMAGMQFSDGQPTYRMILGASGESHALEVAERVGFDGDVVTRARSLMDQGERDLAETLAALDVARSEAEAAARRVEELQADLAERTARVAAREEEIAKRAKALERDRASAFLSRLSEAEKAVGAVVADLQRAPSHDAVRTARATLDALKGLAPTPEEPAAPAPDRPLEVGDRVRLTKLRQRGEVIGVGKRLKIRTERGLTVQVDPGDAQRTADQAPPERAPVPKPSRRAGPSAPDDLGDVLRHDGNTLDLRGQRVDEGIDAVERFVDRALMSDKPVVFVLHGHGTGAMKQAVRDWMRTSPHVARWQPALPDQGGDAYTIAALR